MLVGPLAPSYPSKLGVGLRQKGREFHDVPFGHLKLGSEATRPRILLGALLARTLQRSLSDTG